MKSATWTVWHTIEEHQSHDADVKKYIFKLPDAIAEAVLYKYGSYEERTVMCISTQTGCPMGCTFCGTGKFFGRNLTTQEIVDQVHYMVAANDIDVENVKKMQIMVMSMGEPLLNMPNVAPAFFEFNRMYKNAALLVSTSAPKTPDGWDRFFELASCLPQVGLQFSVHESTDEARDLIMPMKAKLNLEQIALRGEYFHELTGRRPYFNYCVSNFNDSAEDAQRLADLFDPTIWEATLSVICEADVNMKDAVQDQFEMVSAFSSNLVELGFNTRVFNPSGVDDVGGGCGQLWSVQEYAKANPDHFQQSAGNKIACRQMES